LQSASALLYILDLGSSPAAKRAVFDYLAVLLAKLLPEQLAWINTLVETTANKREVIEQLEAYSAAKSVN
jgi:hypothetical protein